VVITAAHCVNGTGAGLRFVPGYTRGRAPYGVWQVAAAYVDPRWRSRQDPRHDYAFLVLAPHVVRGRRVLLQDAVPGGLLRTAPATGRKVTVIAYPAGIGDDPISCTARVYRYRGFPAFDCHGYTTGVSGGPFLTADPGGGTAVRGVIGGLNQGGCSEFTSYTSSFTADAAATLRRAQPGARSDVLPVAGPSGC
jgi:V8-like Glu-specific endopeptidase